MALNVTIPGTEIPAFPMGRAVVTLAEATTSTATIPAGRLGIIQRHLDGPTAQDPRVTVVFATPDFGQGDVSTVTAIFPISRLAPVNLTRAAGVRSMVEAAEGPPTT